jgi:CRP-like cAMP-binding protein
MTTSTPTEIAELESTLPFARLCAAEREKIRDRLSVVEIPAGKHLIKEGTPGAEMYFIAKGSVKVCSFHNDKEVILAILRQGEVVGDIALLCGGPRVADVVALTACRLLKCTKEDFEAHLLEFGGLALAMLKNLALRVRSASSRISDLALYDVSSRVARILFEMSVPSEYDGVPAHVLHDPPTHQALASMIGSSREAVTRALKELEKARHLVIEEGQIFVLSLPL